MTGKRLLLSLLFLCLSSFLFSQQWGSSPVPHGRGINSTLILSPDVFIVAGGHEWNDSLQSLFRSDNGGLNWAENPTDDISSWIKSVAFSDTVIGFGVGYNGKMVKTTDGGRNWAKLSSPVIRHFFKVIYTDPQTLFIVGGNYANDTATILKSTNGGTNWNVVYDKPGKWLRGLHFSDSQNGFAVGDSSQILITTNGGINWNPVSAPLIDREFSDITFVNADTGFIIGGHSSQGLRTVLVTADGGASWNLQSEQTGGRLNDVFFLNSNTGYLCGDSSTLFKTTDGGWTWTSQIVPNSLPSNNFNSVYFYSDSLGIIGSRAGRVYIYTHLSTVIAQTIGHTIIDSMSAQLTGFVNTFGSQGNYTFAYSTDSNLAGAFQLFPINIQTDSAIFVSAIINFLQPNTKYYYYFSAQNVAGVVNGDTLSFTTGFSNYSFQTLPPTAVTATAATFNGSVSGLSEPLNLSFEYGTNPSLSSSITASPASVNDSLTHAVSANVSSLQANSIYHYRLKGTGSNGNYYGGIHSFFAGTPYEIFNTGPAVFVTDSSATLRGTIKNFSLPATFNFEYGLNFPFTNTTPATITGIIDTGFYELSGGLSGLQPNQTYYFRFKAQTAVGTFFGNTLTFFTGPDASPYQTLVAIGVSPSTARIRGLVHQSSPLTASLSFEYGPTSSMGNTIAANPTGVSDTNSIIADVLLTGLQPNTFYSYRLKVNLPGFGDVYGATKQFYTGAPAIPNWDFEDWQVTKFHFPKYWTSLGNNGKVISYNGSTALHLFGNSYYPAGLVLMGVIEVGGSNAPIGGAPFTARPDSMIFFANYSIAAGDTGYAAVILKKNAVNISTNFYPLTGNTAGNFQRKAYPISYTAIGNPDSVIVAFMSSNFLNNQIFAPNRESWLMVDDVTFSGTTQTVPSHDFEEWDSLLYDQALNWTYGFRESPNNLYPFIPYEKSTDAYSGSYAQRFQNIAQLPYSHSGYITTATLNYGPAFPLYYRPRVVNGYIKFLPQANDTMSGIFYFYKNGQLIGSANLSLLGAVPNWTLFECPIAYSDSAMVPDSANLYFRSSTSIQVSGNSVAYLDALGFDGIHSDSVNTPLNITAPERVREFGYLHIYPNPSNSILNIETESLPGGETKFVVFAETGQAVYQFTSANNNIATIDVSKYRAGIYFIAALHNKTVAYAKFVKQ